MIAFDVGAAAELACLLEATAPKPGNVSPGRSFVDLTYQDFLLSAVAIRPVMAAAGTRPIGATVRLAVEATRRSTPSNTNLGIVLLLGPLARAAVDTVDSGKRDHRIYRDTVRRVLQATTVDDAREVYAAIRLAAPGGLGRVAEQDVASEPTETLLETMQLAAGRDQIAREYGTAFETTFDVAAPALVRARGDGLDWDDAIVEVFLSLLACSFDTHVVRRGGESLAADVSRRARSALEAGGVRSAAGRRAVDDMDRALRDARNSANPGATADLTAAAISVQLVTSFPEGFGRAGKQVLA